LADLLASTPSMKYRTWSKAGPCKTDLHISSAHPPPLLFHPYILSVQSRDTPACQAAALFFFSNAKFVRISNNHKVELHCVPTSCGLLYDDYRRAVLTHPRPCQYNLIFQHLKLRRSREPSTCPTAVARSTGTGTGSTGTVYSSQLGLLLTFIYISNRHIPQTCDGSHCEFPCD